MTGTPPPIRPGFSLLEVVLAMALSALVFVGLGFFSTWQSQLAESRHRTISESQVARVVLDQLSRDLRNVVIRPNASNSPAVTTSATSSTSGTGSTSTGTSLSASNASGTSTSTTGSSVSGTSTSSSSSTSTSANSNLTQTGTVSAVPGVYGTANQLQIDVYHIPSFSERLLADQAIAMGNPLSGLSDVRTTLYFVDVPRTAESTETDSTQTASAATPHLLKVNLPRATVMWQSSNGGLASLWSQGRTYASEVRMMECWYFDGTQWLNSWNTELYGRLPVAVQILIWVDSADDPVSLPPTQLRDAATSNSVTNVDVSHIYSTVVTFPVTGSTSGSTVGSTTGSTSSNGTTTGGTTSATGTSTATTGTNSGTTTGTGR